MVSNSICPILEIISNYFQFDVNRVSFLWYYLVYYEKFYSWMRCILQLDRMKQYVERYKETFMKRTAIWLCGCPEFMVNIYTQNFSYFVLKSKAYFSIVVFVKMRIRTFIFLAYIVLKYCNGDSGTRDILPKLRLIRYVKWY